MFEMVKLWGHQLSHQHIDAYHAALQLWGFKLFGLRVSNQAFDWLAPTNTPALHFCYEAIQLDEPKFKKPLAHFWNPQLCGVSWGTRTQQKECPVHGPTIHPSIQWWWCICGCWFTLATSNMYFLNNGKEVSDHMINCNGNNIVQNQQDLPMRSTESGPEPAPITQCENY
jgi:hypothetical protein